MRISADKIDIKKINEFIEELDKIVNADNTISNDEEQILNSILADLNNYKKLLDDVLEDGEINDEEMKKIIYFKERILHNASSRAFGDGKITAEERLLLNAVVSFVDNENI
jgi:uncharacterized tellurite resistance protein B-like protein